MLLRGVLCIKDRAAVCVHDDGGGAADLGRGRPVGRNLVDQCVNARRIALCGVGDDGRLEKYTAGKQTCAEESGAQCAGYFFHRMKFQSGVLSIIDTKNSYGVCFIETLFYNERGKNKRAGWIFSKKD